MKIPIKKYVDDPSLSWEERYKRLEAHHTEETQWMYAELKRKHMALSLVGDKATRMRTYVNVEHWDDKAGGYVDTYGLGGATLEVAEHSVKDRGKHIPEDEIRYVHILEFSKVIKGGGLGYEVFDENDNKIGES